MTPTAVISVRGTIFDVSTNDDDETTIVSVEEGSVEVRHALRPGAPKIVNAGESLYVYKDEPLAKSIIDKNELFHRIMRGLGDAAYRLAIRSRRDMGASAFQGCGVGVRPGTTSHRRRRPRLLLHRDSVHPVGSRLPATSKTVGLANHLTHSNHRARGSTVPH